MKALDLPCMIMEQCSNDYVRKQKDKEKNFNYIHKCIILNGLFTDICENLPEKCRQHEKKTYYDIDENT